MKQTENVAQTIERMMINRSRGYTPFGKVVRLLQHDAGINTTNLGKLIGMTPSNISAMLRGRRRITEQAIDGIVEHLTDDSSTELTMRTDANVCNGDVVIDVSDSNIKNVRLATLFASRLNNLNDDEITEITKQLTRSDEASEYK